jgi:hypothetical protein
MGVNSTWKKFKIMEFEINLIRERIKKYQKIQFKFDIKIKWNLMIKDEIQENNQLKKIKK